jgi:hypothetical protein
MTASDLPDISPEAASRGDAGHLPDELLPMLAAVWLAEGYDSEELRELAALSRQEARQAGRRRLAQVLASLGYPMREWRHSLEELPWLGYWRQIEFAQAEMDRLLTPYASAQRVVEVAGDVPDLWGPAGGERLMSLLRDWDEIPSDRSQIEGQLREHVRSLRAEDVPPLITGP